MGWEYDNDAVGLNADLDDNEVESGLGSEEVLWEVPLAIERHILVSDLSITPVTDIFDIVFQIQCCSLCGELNNHVYREVVTFFQLVF